MCLLSRFYTDGKMGFLLENEGRSGKNIIGS